MSSLRFWVVLHCTLLAFSTFEADDDAVGLLQINKAGTQFLTAPGGMMPVIQHWVAPIFHLEGYRKYKELSGDETAPPTKEIMMSTNKGVEVITQAIDETLTLWEAIEKGVAPAIERLTTAKTANATDFRAQAEAQKDVIIAYLYYLSEAQGRMVESAKKVRDYYENDAPAAVKLNYKNHTIDIDEIARECRTVRPALEEVLAYTWKADLYHFPYETRLLHVSQTIKEIVAMMTKWTTDGTDRNSRDTMLKQIEEMMVGEGVPRVWGKGAKKMSNRMYALSVLMSKVWLSFGVGVTFEAPGANQTAARA